jgi:hypothetical protein
MKLDWLTFQRIKWYFRGQEGVIYRHHLIRATLLRNSKILCEYDFIQERMLSRAQALSRATTKRDFDILKSWVDGSWELWFYRPVFHKRPIPFDMNIP